VSREPRWLPWLALFGICVIWGSTYFAIRIMVRELPPWSAAGLRFLVAGAVMTAIAVRVEGAGGRPSRRQLLDYSLIGVLLLGVANGLVTWAETRVHSSVAALTVATVPIWITFFDGLRPGGQPWTLRVWIGTALGFAGVALVLRPEGGPGELVAMLALALAPLSWTAGALYSQSLRQRLPSLSAAAVEMLAGSLALFAFAAIAGEDPRAFLGASGQAWLAWGYLVVFGAIVAFTSFAYALDRLPAPTVGIYAYVNPVIAVGLGTLLLDEPLSAGLLLGGLLIVGSVLLITRGRRPPLRRRPEPGSPRLGSEREERAA
jgi:drug/metabolite transporter (DMT)-like permease